MMAVRRQIRAQEWQSTRPLKGSTNPQHVEGGLLFTCSPIVRHRY